MRNKLVYLTITDLLIYSMVAKFQSGINIEEQKNNICYTMPQTYFWIFLLNEKYQKNLSPENQNSLVRLIFWTMQIIYNLKRYYKEPKNRKKKFHTLRDLFTKISWFKNKIDIEDITGIRTLNLTPYFNQFEKELNNSSLEQNKKQFIKTLAQEKMIYVSRNIQKYMYKDFNKFSINDVIGWQKITYEIFSDFFINIYLAFQNITPDSKEGLFAFDFLRSVVCIEALHDDMTDIISDIDSKGILREPNIFASFLSDSEKFHIGNKYQGKSTLLTIQETKLIAPKAYKKCIQILKQYLQQVPSIPYLNTHELLEFCFFHFPPQLIGNFASESNHKKHHINKSINILALHKKCLDVINEFKSLGQNDQEKRFSQLLQYLFVIQLFQSGYHNNKIIQITGVNKSTISRWLNQKTLPISIRHLKNSTNNKEEIKWFMLG
ncbi:MAG: hypothetical protein Q7R95_09190, partial [bacterium]|nr:hypothetical protein [bacterium]